MFLHGVNECSGFQFGIFARTAERAQPERDVGGDNARAKRQRRFVGGRGGRREHTVDRGRRRPAEAAREAAARNHKVEAGHAGEQALEPDLIHREGGQDEVDGGDGDAELKVVRRGEGGHGAWRPLVAFNDDERRGEWHLGHACQPAVNPYECMKAPTSF